MVSPEISAEEESLPHCTRMGERSSASCSPWSLSLLEYIMPGIFSVSLQPECSESKMPTSELIFVGIPLAQGLHIAHRLSMQICRSVGGAVESQRRDEGQRLTCSFLHIEMVWSVPGDHLFYPVVLPAGRSCFLLAPCQWHVPLFYMAEVEEGRHVLNEKAGVRLPSSFVGEWL